MANQSKIGDIISTSDSQYGHNSPSQFDFSNCGPSLQINIRLIFKPEQIQSTHNHD